MSPPDTRGPKLPIHLLKQIGGSETSTSTGKPGCRQGHGRSKPQELSRKERRKAERAGKKAQRGAQTQQHVKKPTRPGSTPAKMYPKSILKPKAPEPEGSDDEDDDDDEDEDDDDNEDEDDDDDEDEDDDDDEDENMYSDGGEEKQSLPPASRNALPKVVREKLAQDDAEIEELERKLGMKGRKTLPQSFKDDGLGDLLEGMLGGDVDDETQERKKRKAEADEWLASKRRKAVGQAEKDRQRLDGNSDSDLEGLDDDDEDKLGEDSEGDDDGSEGDQDDFGEFDSDVESEPELVKRVRENPYVAPVTQQESVKYVPPSLRKETGSDVELLSRIRRQTQGLVNRVTESNLLAILGDIEKLYRDNPRQHVTSVLVDLLLIQVCDRTALPDTLLILTAGFATAACRVIGMDFGAQFIQEVVERFDRFYEEAKDAAAEHHNVPKQTSNLITLLSQLYNFQIVGPNLLFDYIRLFLGDLSELTAELLLRIIRMSGPALRQEDPMSLKDIVSLIRPAVTKIGEQNLSVRTKFMIETINDLKNNKMKAGAGASAIVSEHNIRMKKTLGTLNARKLKSTEPLRIGLKDIRDSDKKGKWWLVGASWAGPSKDKSSKKPTVEGKEDEDQDDDDESLLLSSDDEGIPDPMELAKQHKMNTDVRRSIFVAIMYAADYEDAYLRILKLRLNKKQQTEVAHVVIYCSGTEQQYNPYYTLIAQKLCTDRKIRWSFQDNLWKLFRRLGESIFGDDVEEAEETDEDEDAELRRLVNNAKMFGSLVASGTLALSILKCLTLPLLQEKTRAFVEIMLTTTLQECKSDKEREGAIASVFGAVEAVPELATGLQWFLKKVVRKSRLVGSEAKTKQLKDVCKEADGVLRNALSAARNIWDDE
ncbi:hypothetical protein B0T25DRAFT_273857 [Lasiosphaeria hispida]|uniref:MI domain-containing protein n=1 Tax=Lasiosphaeria hispida TaxID=260671 RepID=A0AAJ0HAZ9_9PEZI|nr:hypothetical protein B0T25DRAFT_273857 [Lasiosphaeria hispida]